MAAPITHLVLAEKLYTKLFAAYSYGEFMLGTSFPDIRYAVGLDKKRTHLGESSDLSQVLAVEDSFRAGIKFHSLVDRELNLFMDTSGIYDLCPTYPTVYESLKFMQDRLYYSLLSSDRWDQLVRCFSQIVPQENEFSISKESLRAWHENMASYIAFPPTVQTLKAHFRIFPVTEEKIDTLSYQIEGLMSNQAVVSLLNQWLQDFCSRMTER